jgi:hypothetical protein
VNHHLDGVADLKEFWIDCERELAEGEDAFGLSADVDEDFVLIFLDEVLERTWPSSRTLSDSSYSRCSNAS